MAKKSFQYIQLVNEKNPETGTKYIIKKSTKGVQATEKMRFRKYDRVLRKHCWFIERKMPSHSKN